MEFQRPLSSSSQQISWNLSTNFQLESSYGFLIFSDYVNIMTPVDFSQIGSLVTPDKGIIG